MDFFCCQGKLSEVEFQLTGSDAYAARFGETIADLGDLDDDGYPGKDHSNTARQLTFYIHTIAAYMSYTFKCFDENISKISKTTYAVFRGKPLLFDPLSRSAGVFFSSSFTAVFGSTLTASLPVQNTGHLYLAICKTRLHLQRQPR